MKKHMNWSLWITTGLVFVVLSAAPTASDAQILKNLGRKVEKKVENQINRRVERQVDKAIDKTFDNVEEGVEDAVKGNGQNTSGQDAPPQRTRGQQTNQTDASSSGTFSSILGGSQNVAIRDQYEFVIGVSYDITNTQGTSADKLPSMTLWLSNDSYIGMTSEQQQTMFMVMDDGGMISFMEEQKRYMAMSANTIGQIAGSAAKQVDIPEGDDIEYSFTRIGSETILGLSSDIYEVQTESSKARIWITQAIDIPTGAYGMALSSLSQIQGENNRFPDLSTQPSGVMLKMESTDIETDQHILMEATAIHRDGKALNTAGYQSFGF